MKRAPSIVGTPSIYSHSHTSYSNTTRSAGHKSFKSSKLPWYKTPWLQNRFPEEIQKYAFITSIYSIILSIFTLVSSVFDLYCLSEAAPGSTHSGYYVFSFDFVYVGNRHVRNILITIAILSAIASIPLLITSSILVQALRQEYEKKMVPWLVTMFLFSVFRLFSFIFVAIVNDLIFTYNVLMCLLWISLSFLSFFGLAFVYSLYLELADLTRLEDIADLRIGTMASLTTQSLMGSRPTTPHTGSTMPLQWLNFSPSSPQNDSSTSSPLLHYDDDIHSSPV